MEGFSSRLRRKVKRQGGFVTGGNIDSSRCELNDWMIIVYQYGIQVAESIKDEGCLKRMANIIRQQWMVEDRMGICPRNGVNDLVDELVRVGEPDEIIDKVIEQLPEPEAVEPFEALEEFDPPSGTVEADTLHDVFQEILDDPSADSIEEDINELRENLIESVLVDAPQEALNELREGLIEFDDVDELEEVEESIRILENLEDITLDPIEFDQLDELKELRDELRDEIEPDIEIDELREDVKDSKEEEALVSELAELFEQEIEQEMIPQIKNEEDLELLINTIDELETDSDLGFLAEDLAEGGLITGGKLRKKARRILGGRRKCISEAQCAAWKEFGEKARGVSNMMDNDIKFRTALRRTFGGQKTKKKRKKKAKKSDKELTQWQLAVRMGKGITGAKQIYDKATKTINMQLAADLGFV